MAGPAGSRHRPDYENRQEAGELAGIVLLQRGAAGAGAGVPGPFASAANVPEVTPEWSN